MLPISLVERPGFVEYIKAIDPSFTFPTRERIKSTLLPAKRTKVEEKLASILETIPYVNMSTDGWTDASQRCFNGFVAQGIDNEWKMRTLFLAFNVVKGDFLIQIDYKLHKE
jgi:hypothetical protein